MGEVTQADRDAAEKVYRALFEWFRNDGIEASRMYENTPDDDELVQAFAKHRLAAEPAWQPIVSAPRDGTWFFAGWTGADSFTPATFLGNRLHRASDMSLIETSPDVWLPFPVFP